MDYDANPIQVCTQFSYEQMKAYQRFHFRKSKKNTIVLICFFVLMILISFDYSDFPNLGNNSDLISLLSPMLLIFFMLIFLAFVFNGGLYTRKAHAKSTKLLQNGQSYSFCNNHFIIRTEQQDNIGQSQTSYTLVFCVWETADMFYVYINKNQAYLIDKQGFATGNPDELRELLQSHIPPKKYKKYKV